MAKDDKPDEKAEDKSKDSAQNVSAGGWEERKKARWKEFPGPRGADELLRITMTRKAYADITAHAKESLNAEICGVVVGEVCEDDGGVYVAVEGTIRGTAAKKGSTHVTFTHETWNEIHKEKEKQHPRRQIVGWYHSHPGFGVEFSEMDRFIQKNFFSGPAQIAFVTDPLGGQEAILANSDGQLVPIGRFWVEGREKSLVTPDSDKKLAGKQSAASDSPAGGGEIDKTLKSMEDRIRQLTASVEQQQDSYYKFLLTIGMIVAVGVILYLGYNIWTSYTANREPPKVVGEWSTPVMVGDKKVMLLGRVYAWEIPKELDPYFIEAEKQRLEEAAKKAKEEAKDAAKDAKPTTAP